MRIGLFTDTYRPSINGIVFVVETLKKRLEEQGHEVFIFCPAKSIRPSLDL
ncbi:glycosyltransferase family 4 protein, partial [Candidatus Saccharibacteria bacterium]|nr:glycosyltransferase family 4 protein [Candidatus Saccharibacteria bacterium]